MRLITHIVLHTSGTYDYRTRSVVYATAASMRAYHIEHNGWRDLGYHWVVEEDGQGVAGRDDHDIGAHVGGFNSHSLGLCVSGHGDFAPWSGPQMREALRKCEQWCSMYRVPVEHVIGHREVSEHGGPRVSKTCPGLLVDMGRFRKDLAARLSGGGEAC